MIIPDINLLIYAHNAGVPQHAKAKNWLESVFNGDATVGLSWAVILGFMRLMSNRRVLQNPWPCQDLVDAVTVWAALPHVQIIHPGPRHLEILGSFAHQGLLASELTTDAHLAALAIEHQAQLCSNDSDFSRFPGLRVINPLKL